MSHGMHSMSPADFRGRMGIYWLTYNQCLVFLRCKSASLPLNTSNFGRSIRNAKKPRSGSAQAALAQPCNYSLPFFNIPWVCLPASFCLCGMFILPVATEMLISQMLTSICRPRFHQGASQPGYCPTRPHATINTKNRAASPRLQKGEGS